MNEFEENGILEKIKNSEIKDITILGCRQEFSTKLCIALVKYKIEGVLFLNGVNLTEEALRELAKSKTLKYLHMNKVKIFGNISVLKENRSLINVNLEFDVILNLSLTELYLAPFKYYKADPLYLGERNIKIHSMVKNAAILSVFILKKSMLGKDMANKIGRLVWETRFDKEWTLSKPTLLEKATTPFKHNIGIFYEFLFEAVLFIYCILFYFAPTDISSR